MQLLQTSDVPAAETVLTAVLRVHQLVAVIDVVETGWGHDRDSKIVSEARFGEITGRIWASLRDQSIKALAMAS